MPCGLCCQQVAGATFFSGASQQAFVHHVIQITEDGGTAAAGGFL